MPQIQKLETTNPINNDRLETFQAAIVAAENQRQQTVDRLAEQLVRLNDHGLFIDDVMAAYRKKMADRTVDGSIIDSINRLYRIAPCNSPVGLLTP